MSGLSSSRIYVDKKNVGKNKIAAFDNGNQRSFRNKVGFGILLKIFKE